MRRKILCMVGMIFAVVALYTVSVSAITRDQAVNWAKTQANNGVMYKDSGFGGQCTDFVSAYMNYIVYGDAHYWKNTGGGGFRTYDAKDYFSKSYPSGWQKISNTPDFVPQPGDILCFGANSSNSFGHVAVAIEGCTVSIMKGVGQNGAANNYKGTAAQYQTMQYFGGWGNFQGVIRPKWDSGEQPVNLGDNFYAVILNKACWKPLEVQDDGWVLLASEKGIARQVWRFNRESDGSYKIATALNGNVMDVQQSGKENGSRVGTYTDKAGNNQRWFIYAKNGGYTLKPKHADKRLDLNGGNSADGTKLQIWDNNNTDAQIFAIYKGDDVQLKSPTLSASVNQSNSKVTFDWNEVYGESRYDVKIWKNKIYQGDAYHIEWGAGHNYSIQLPPGYYEAYVDASNAFECKMSNVVGFTVPAQSAMFNLTCTDNISTIINNTSLPQTVTIVVAEYSNGALSNVSTHNETFAPNETKTYSHAANARVFVWDSLRGMKPLAN